MNRELPDHVAELLPEHDAAPGLLCLEITESGFMEDPLHAQKALDRLAEEQAARSRGARELDPRESRHVRLPASRQRRRQSSGGLRRRAESIAGASAAARAHGREAAPVQRARAQRIQRRDV